jgi:hypothetical protein
MTSTKGQKLNGFIPLIADHSFVPLLGSSEDAHTPVNAFQPFQAPRQALAAESKYIETRRVLGR